MSSAPQRNRARTGLLLSALALLAFALYVFISTPDTLEPKLLTLGGLAKQLADDPATFDALLERLGSNGQSGFVGPEDKDRIEKLFVAKDFAALDRLPRLTLQELALTLKALAASRTLKPPPEPSPPSEEPLGLPASGAPPESVQVDLGLGLRYGDRVDPEKAVRFRDSERLAALFDRLALNKPEIETESFRVALGGGDTATTAEALVSWLARNGHTIEVLDERFAANFGDIEKDGEQVATPMWIATGWKLADGTELELPAVHAQVTLRTRGPLANADVTLYNTLDIPGTGGGGTSFRPDLADDQAWVGHVVANRYTDDRALRAVRIMALLRRASEEKVRAHQLPLDGYFSLGVCTLAPALVEQAVTGRTTLWPLTHDVRLFNSESEVDRLVRTLPADDGTQTPDKMRLIGSIPWFTLEDVPFPHLVPWLEELGFPKGPI